MKNRQSGVKLKLQKKLGFSLKHMDFSKDPFQDFYRYSCGSWISRNLIPKDKVSISPFYQLSEANLLILRGIIESCVTNPSKYKNGKLIKRLYTSFMDVRRRDQTAFRPIEHLLKRVDSIDGRSDIPELVTEMYKSGCYPFFGIASYEDEKNSSIYALHIWQGGINLPSKEYYTSKKFSQIRKEYLNYMRTAFLLYGHSNTEAYEIADRVISVEDKLALYSRTPVELRDSIKNYHKFYIKDLEKRYRNIDIRNVSEGLYVKNLDYVVIGQPEFFNGLDRIIYEEDFQKIKDYLKWIVIESNASILHSELVKANFDFFGKKLMGHEKMPPLWKHGVSIVSSLLSNALEELYVEEAFDSESIREAVSLVKDMRSAFMKRLASADWMSNLTKRKALEKLGTMGFKVGRPRRFKDYKGLVIESDSIVENCSHAIDFYIKRRMSKVGKKVEKNKWKMAVYEVNAYYDPSKNEIVIPAGILQPPFFDASMDDAVNYGSIGGIIGHELTHGFDDDGSRFDLNGNLKSWWTNEDRRRFEKKGEVVERIYSSLEALPGIKVNGKLTLGENIADLGGIQIAYDALLKRVGSDGLSKKFRGFTEEQRFFIAWAQIWRNKTRPETKKVLLNSGVHSPEEFRGSIPVLAHEAFPKAFEGKSRLRKPKVAYGGISLW